jgi:tripartite-type tricarboxylate transporter receptor subunit TctC
MVDASLPIQSIRDLFERLKVKPEGANASGAAGIHQLGFELFKSQTGTRGQYIPYKSTTQSINAVIAGEVLMTVADAGAASGALPGHDVGVRPPLGCAWQKEQCHRVAMDALPW